MSNTPKEISEYMSSLGKRGGATNKKKGKEYFQYVRSHRKAKPAKENDEQSNRA